MCGIIGIVTKQELNMSAMLKTSLLQLTCRGYDSYGIAVMTRGQLNIKKGRGKADRLRITDDMMGTAGIGHTRWATHGKVCLRNAHPHVDCRKDIAVVHNGIIDNYYTLKQELIAKGHVFRSDTDTEVIPHLIEDRLHHYKNTRCSTPFLMAFRDSIARLEGTYSIATLWNGDGKIYAARKTSPLLIGKGEKTHFIASDINAFLEHTNVFITLRDFQIAVLSDHNCSVYDYKLKPQVVEGQSYPFTVEMTAKGKYEHFMLKEIEEQDVVLNRLYQNLDEIVRVAQRITRDIKSINRIYLTGCGSSFNACIAGKCMAERLLKLPAEAVLASEFRSIINNIDFQDSLVIALSQSGETLDTYNALEDIARIHGNVSVISITNNPYSSIERLVREKFNGRGLILRLHAGPEKSVIATKTFTAQSYLLALLIIEIGLSTPSKEAKIELTSLLKESMEIPNKVRTTLDCIDSQAKILVDKYIKYSWADTEGRGVRENFFTIGRGIHLSTAYEAALKLRETCYLTAIGIAGGELKHGSLAAFDQDTLVVFFFPPLTELVEWNAGKNNCMEVQSRGSNVISVCGRSSVDNQIKLLSSDVISIPDTHYYFSSILSAVTLQSMSYHIAVKKGINPDFPKHLAKTVTVE